MSENRVWDYTTIDCFQTCRKKYYWQMVRHLQTKTKSNALLFGGEIHDALDLHYTVGNEAALRHFGETFKNREGDELRTVENGLKMLEWYGKVYRHEPFKVLGKPELGFVFPLGDILWGGRMDLPVLWNGDLWIVEHKTTSILRGNYFNQFELDKQVTGYIMGAEAFLGKKCYGCLINAMQPWKELKRPTYKSKKPEEHFVRCPVTRSKALKERFTLNVNRIVRDILWCEENNEFYEAEKKDICFNYNYNCPYLDLCKYGEDERLVEKEYTVVKWEPYKDATRKETSDEKV